MSAPIQPGDHDVVLTGALSNIRPHTDGGVLATLTHPEFPAQVHIPTADLPTGAWLIEHGAKVTVGGTWAGDTIRVEAVSAGTR